MTEDSNATALDIFSYAGIEFVQIQPLRSCSPRTNSLYNNRKTTFFLFSLDKTTQLVFVANATALDYCIKD